MLPDSGPRRSHPQLFQFVVPGLPETRLAVAMQEVLGVSTLSAVTPVPFAPPFIVGLARWQDSAATVVSLAGALGANGAAPFNHNPAIHHLIVRVAVDGRLDTVAWPILPGAGTVSIPPQAVRTAVPANLNAKMVYAAIDLLGSTIVLVDLAGLAAHSRAVRAFATPRAREAALPTHTAQAEGCGRLNINTAAPTTLATLPRIGPVLAKRIVAYRDKAGAFGRIEDVQEVSGIGEETFEKIRHLISVDADSQEGDVSEGI